MEKRAIITVKSFSDIEPNEAIEVVHLEHLLYMKMDLKLYMKNLSYLEWMGQQLH